MKNIISEYRTHNCGELRESHENQTVMLCGWLHRKRDHGGILFIDLRDHYGITQCVIDPSIKISLKTSSTDLSKHNTQDFPEAIVHNLQKSADNSIEALQLIESTPLESVILIRGKVITRSPATVNPKMDTGTIEVQVEAGALLSMAQPLPFTVNSDQDFPEDLLLRYRFLALRREDLHSSILLRTKVISSLRQRMISQGFLEIQTPILTSSSPEGARDYLVPSRIHPGKFYALPQAPQQFKQLLMVAGFDRYFQIAPCFRDEDARADRSPGEFYQLDFEMSFVTQQQVFDAIEPVLHGVFSEFSNGRVVSPYPFPQIAYDEALAKYGSDKPDLRNPLLISDATSVFANSGFTIFANAINSGSVVKAIGVSHAASQPRGFFDKLNDWARAEGKPGLGYIVFDESNSAKGPIAKFLTPENLSSLQSLTNTKAGDAVFFVCDLPKIVHKFAGQARTKIAHELNLIDQNQFKFCWVVDFPMYEYDEEKRKIDFSHNPFSMPQGGLNALETKDPLTIKAWQYDIVCNGVELSSGAIRNHIPEVMYKAFAIAGYSAEDVETKFGGLLNAFKFGAPPHGGSAPGIDRIVMLLAQKSNLREVIAFPLNQQAQDLLMQAPNHVTPERLRELHIKLNVPPPRSSPSAPATSNSPQN